MDIQVACIPSPVDILYAGGIMMMGPNWSLKQPIENLFVYDGVFPCLIIVTSDGKFPCVGWITLFVMFVAEARGPSWVQVIR